MRILLCAVLACLMTSTASAQFAKRSEAARNKADADAAKPAAQPAPAANPAPAQPAAGAAAPNALFAALDLDGDGIISKVELRKAIVSLKKLDKDNDGQLTMAECGIDGAPAAGQAAANNDPTPWVDRIMANDKNKDGKLTPDELTDNEKQMLQGADANNDGAIDRQELMAYASNQNALNGAAGAFNNAAGAGMVPGARGGNNEAMAGFFRYDRNHDGKLTPDEVP
ncbi:MAG TPA: hypothetical protein VHU84_04520, partial [Lacipirellulaceae bacterium]|nr:hypothetical protein [Lacipirellulaceae bacterium]